MNRFQRSWALFRCSIQVIGKNKKLLLFPVIISVLMAFIALFFIAPIALWDTGHSYTASAHWSAVAHRWLYWDTETKALEVNPAGYALLAGLYLASVFFATFFNVAFYSQIIGALQGRPVSISGGLRVAVSRLGAILAWSLFAGLIGLLIKALEERVGVVGRWIVKLIGLAWSVASIFVIPSIVLETAGANPVNYLRNSAALLRKTWGESLIGFVGIQLGGLLVLLVSLVFLGLSTYLSVRLQNYWILGIATLLWFVGMMAFMYVLSVASHVYRGALFVYASGGVPPAPFQPDQMSMAWKVKQGS